MIARPALVRRYGKKIARLREALSEELVRVEAAATRDRAGMAFARRQQLRVETFEPAT